MNQILTFFGLLQSKIADLIQWQVLLGTPAGTVQRQIAMLLRGGTAIEIDIHVDIHVDICTVSLMLLPGHGFSDFFAQRLDLFDSTLREKFLGYICQAGIDGNGIFDR